MSLKKRARGIYEETPGRFVVQVSRRTRRVTGTLADARAVHAQLLLEVQEQRSKSGSRAPGASCPTLAEWMVGRYARWQERAQNERTRRKLVSPIRYLLASDLSGLPLDRIGTAEINAYVEWRRNVGAISFSVRKDGERHRARVERVGAQTINKSLKLLSAALNLAKDEGLIASVPKIHFLPEDDARAVIPLTEEQYQLILGELGVDVGKRQHVEGKVPGGVPGVLPLVWH